MKRLILNADDYGMNEAVSRGILEVAAAGTVRSTTAMANCPDFERAMEDLSATESGIDVGIHLTLTWGKPLSDPGSIPTLLDETGGFLKRSVLLTKAIAGSVSEEDVYCEFKLQCERLASRLPRISHLDGHHHVHVFPTISRAAERVAHEFDIQFVRAPREGFWSPWHWEAGKRLGVSLLPASGISYWRSRGFRTPDFFGGYSLGGGEGFSARWLRALDRIPDGVGEIMVHPGHESAENDSYDVGRTMELEWLSGNEFADAAREKGVEFVSFLDLG